jgi:threonine dehydrogenase-like Zn-dependent dehydrogenase
VPQAHYGPIKVPDGPADDRFVYLSDVLPTAWQAVKYADLPPGGSVVILGLGPIGSMAARIATHLGASKVIGIDLVDERLERARMHGADVLDLQTFDDDRTEVADAVRDLTGGGPHAVIDAVGMEAHGSGGAKVAQAMTALMPDKLNEKLMQRAGVDRLAALEMAVELVRRGGTISISGVYGGMSDPLPMMVMFDKQIQLRMGQANVKRWIDEILPLVTDRDVLGVEDFASHHLPLDDAAHAYEIFQEKKDDAVKIVFNP